jgi:hypothetical protein
MIPDSAHLNTAPRISADPGAVILDAINLTLKTIEGRARLYRKIVVCVSVTFVAALILAAGLRSWQPLVGLILLVPVSGAFLAIDSRKVRSWQTSMLQMWRVRGLDLGEFERLIAKLGHVPVHTVRGMLMVLPMQNAKSMNRQCSDAQKESISNSLQLAVRANEHKTLLTSAALTIFVSCLVAVAVWRSEINAVSCVGSGLLWLLARKLGGVDSSGPVSQPLSLRERTAMASELSDERGN